MADRQFETFVTANLSSSVFGFRVQLPTESSLTLSLQNGLALNGDHRLAIDHSVQSAVGHSFVELRTLLLV